MQERVARHPLVTFGGLGHLGDGERVRDHPLAGLAAGGEAVELGVGQGEGVVDRRRQAQLDLAEEQAGRPDQELGSERFAGAIDSVGGNTLANLLTQVKYGGSVSACGLAGGAELKTTVIPFLLRGVNLLGIDSVMCPSQTRLEVWQRLASDLKPPRLAAATRTWLCNGCSGAGTARRICAMMSSGVTLSESAS